jgi:hypothetical protein
LRFLISMMILDWVSYLAYPNLFGIKGFVVVVKISYNSVLTQAICLEEAPSSYCL